MISASVYFTFYHMHLFCTSQGSLLKTLQEVRPTRILAVPRVWEKIYEKMQEVGRQSGAIKRAIATWAKGHGLQHNLDKMNGWAGTKAVCGLFHCYKLHHCTFHTVCNCSGTIITMVCEQWDLQLSLSVSLCACVCTCACMHSVWDCIWKHKGSKTLYTIVKINANICL